VACRATPAHLMILGQLMKGIPFGDIHVVDYAVKYVVHGSSAIVW